MHSSDKEAEVAVVEGVEGADEVEEAVAEETFWAAEVREEAISKAVSLEMQSGPRYSETGALALALHCRRIKMVFECKFRRRIRYSAKHAT